MVGLDSGLERDKNQRGSRLGSAASRNETRREKKNEFPRSREAKDVRGSSGRFHCHATRPIASRSIVDRCTIRRFSGAVRRKLTAESWFGKSTGAEPPREESVDVVREATVVQLDDRISR